MITPLFPTHHEQVSFPELHNVENARRGPTGEKGEDHHNHHDRNLVLALLVAGEALALDGGPAHAPGDEEVEDDEHQRRQREVGDQVEGREVDLEVELGAPQVLAGVGYATV